MCNVWKSGRCNEFQVYVSNLHNSNVFKVLQNFQFMLFLLHLYGMYFLYHGRFNDVHNRFFGLIDGQLWRVILKVKNMNLTKNANINFAESQDVWKLKMKHNNMHLHTSLCYSSLVNLSIFLITSTIFMKFHL